MKVLLNFIKQLFIVFIVLFSFSNTYSQVTVNIQQPPFNQLRIVDLWKINLNNTNPNPLPVYLYGTLTEENAGLIATATSSQILLNSGLKIVNANELEPILVGYPNTNPKYKESIIRTGNMPSGNYEMCVYVKMAGSNQDLGFSCIQQTIAYVPAPTLISPVNGESVQLTQPIFTWMQAIGPGINAVYNIKIVEIKHGQSPEIAIQTNPAWFTKDGLIATVFQYPISARNFENNTSYAWQVQAFDNGYPVGENNGYSEVESFELVSLTNDGKNWANNYKNCPPKDNEEVDKEPIFHWNPYPTGNAEYQLMIWEAQSDNGGVITTSGEPYFSIGNLTNNFYHYISIDPSLTPGEKYVYNVSATVGEQIITGVNIQMTIEAVSTTDSAETLEDLYDRLRELKEEIDSLRKMLEENPLVEEITFLQTLLELLQGDEDLLDVVQDILDGKLDELLNDPETVIKGLDYLEKLLRFMAETDTDKADLYNRLANRMKWLKGKLENAKDNADRVEEIINEIKNFFDELKEAAENPFDFFEGELKEKLKEKLKELLTKLLGSKVAGSLFSILSDLINFADAYLIIDEIEGLDREYNKILKRFLREYLGEYSFLFINHVWLEGCEFENKRIRITAEKHCWKPTPGGEPGEGTWESHEMKFEDGSTSHEKNSDDILKNKDRDECEKPRFEFPFRFSEESIGCPPGEGPCFVIITVECFELGSNVPSNTYTVFGGAIQCD